MAAPEGLEPPTLGSEDRCSIQLSYGAAMKLLYLFLRLRRDILELSDFCPSLVLRISKAR